MRRDSLHPAARVVVAKEGCMIITPRDRTLGDKIEVARRIETYARQVDEFGHIMWLPNVTKPSPRGTSSETSQEAHD
jgi:hypothetical protein